METCLSLSYILSYIYENTIHTYSEIVNGFLFRSVETNGARKGKYTKLGSGGSPPSHQKLGNWCWLYIAINTGTKKLYDPPMMKDLGQLMSGPSRFVAQVIAIVYSDKVKVKMLGKPDVLTYF